MTSMKISFEQQYCNFQIMYCLQGLKGERGWKGEKVSIHLTTFRFKVGSRFFIIRHIHNHTSIISSEMQVELKKNTAFT